MAGTQAAPSAGATDGVGISKPMATTSPAQAPVSKSDPPVTSKAADPAPTVASVISKAIDDPALPAKIPGYELRVLDQRKEVMFNVDGRWVKAFVPVFFYYPTGAHDRERVDQLLHAVYEDVVRLGQEPEWTPTEVQRLIVNLNTAIGMNEANP